MFLTSKDIQNKDTILDIISTILHDSDTKEFHMDKTFTESATTDYSLCSQCGGYCCKQCGCHFSPDDFEMISFDYLKGEIEKGYISIDYVDGEILYEPLGVYILRARNRNSPIVDTSFRGRVPCALLTDTGCKLDYDHRPTGGKLLIPSNDTYSLYGSLRRRCHSEYDIDICCREWRSHQSVLYKLIDYFKGKDYPCSI